MTTSRAVATVAGAVLLASRLEAHDTWLLPASPDAAAGASVTLDLTSGMAFPANESAVSPERLHRAAWRLAGKTEVLPAGPAGKTALSLRLVPNAAGIATIWVATKPRTLELTHAQVREYVEEIGAGETAGRDWERAGAGRWRESYAKRAKTFVRVGETAAADRSWGEPVGMDFELVPEGDPTGAAAGAEVAVRLLRDGRPAPGVPVGLLAAGDRTGSLQTTDADGRVRLRPDRPGWWLVRATWIAKSARPDLDWESRFTTLTISVRPAGAP